MQHTALVAPTRSQVVSSLSKKRKRGRLCSHIVADKPAKKNQKDRRWRKMASFHPCALTRPKSLHGRLDWAAEYRGLSDEQKAFFRELGKRGQSAGNRAKAMSNAAKLEETYWSYAVRFAAQSLLCNYDKSLYLLAPA